MAEPQHLRADEGVIPSNPLTAQMEKLLVNVSVWFFFFFRACSPPEVWFSGSSYGWQTDAPFQSLGTALRRATFLTWKGCYLNGKMFHV